MFLFRAVDALSGSINRLVLGSVAPVAMLGEYAGAERITRVFQQGMWPVNQALYPKLTHQTQNDSARAMKTVRLSLFFLGGLGLVFGLAVFLGAPLLVRFTLVPSFENSVLVLHVFAFGFP
jgi:PST family polysaccharide transporter